MVPISPTGANTAGRSGVSPASKHKILEKCVPDSKIKAQFFGQWAYTRHSFSFATTRTGHNNCSRTAACYRTGIFSGAVPLSSGFTLDFLDTCASSIALETNSSVSYRARLHSLRGRQCSNIKTTSSSSYEFCRENSFTGINPQTP